MKYLLIIGVFEALFLIALISGKKNKSFSDLFLGILFLLYALNIGGAYIELYNFENGFPYPILMNVSWLFLLLHGPALWFYISSLSTSAFRFRPAYLLHFVPFLTFLTIHYFNYISLPVQEKINLIVTYLFKDDPFYMISAVSVGVSTIGYNVWAIRLIRSYRMKLEQKFSKLEDIDLSWLKILTLASLVVYCINNGFFIVDIFYNFTSNEMLVFVTFSFASVYILILGFFGLKQNNVFVSQVMQAKTSGSESPLETNTAEIKPTDDDFTARLLHFMESHQPYLDPEISLLKLSELLQVKPEVLSETLNTKLNQNFFDFINKYRIGEFKNQSISQKNTNLSILGIAYNCGFNSKAAFYRAFKKYEGVAPSDYIRSVS